MVVTQEVKHRVRIQPSNSTPRYKYKPKRTDSRYSNKNLCTNIYSNTIHNPPNLETTEMFIHKYMDKQNVVSLYGVSLIAQLVKKTCLQCRRPWFDSWARKLPWRRDGLPTPVFTGFSGGSDSKESTCNAGDLGLIPGLGRSPGGRHGNPLQYSCLENPHEQRSLAGYSP